jgi:hypothetical protein
VEELSCQAVARFLAVQLHQDVPAIARAVNELEQIQRSWDAAELCKLA